MRTLAVSAMLLVVASLCATEPNYEGPYWMPAQTTTTYGRDEDYPDYRDIDKILIDPRNYDDPRYYDDPRNYDDPRYYDDPSQGHRNLFPNVPNPNPNDDPEGLGYGVSTGELGELIEAIMDPEPDLEDPQDEE